MEQQNVNSDKDARTKVFSKTGSSAGGCERMKMDNLPVPVDEFMLTKFLRVVNGKLKDGIAGVAQRAYRVFKSCFIFIKDIVIRAFVDGIPWLLRLLWKTIKFVFGRKMINLVKEHLILIGLFPIFMASLAWPFAVYFYSGKIYWQWIGWIWLVFIGLVGAWVGFKTGLYSKWIKILKVRRANKKSRVVNESTTGGEES